MSDTGGWEPTEFPRAWHLLNTLEHAPRGRYKTVNELHEELQTEDLGADKRTIQRILRYFAERFGLHGRRREQEQGRPLEWAWPEHVGSPTIGTIDPPTALTYEIAGQLLAPVLPDSVYKELEKDFRRARDVLRQTGRPANRITRKIRVLPRGTGRLPASIKPSVLHTVYEALLGNRKTKVTYKPVLEPPKTYAINPLGIVTRFDTLYLVHVVDSDRPDRDPDKVMTWPLHRFSQVTLLQQPAREPADFDLDDALRSLAFLSNIHTETLYQLGESFKLKALFNPRTAGYVIERPFGPDQVDSKTRDGRVRIVATVNNTRELLTQLHDFAADVEVEAPKALRDYFKGLAERLHAQYSD